MLSISRFDTSFDSSDSSSGASTSLSRHDFIDFLYRHLEQFGDSKEAIGCSIDYAFSQAEGNGGFLLAAHDEAGTLVGAAVINRTGMEKFIPAHILVYIAVDGTRRGNGYGKQMVEHIQKECGEGGIALHVEYDNPARRLYERLGFTSKYAEMRYDPSATVAGTSGPGIGRDERTGSEETAAQCSATGK